MADAHLGYSWAQRRRGELGPLADSRTREKLFALTRDLSPTRIVFLGDLVHAPRPCAPEREWIQSTLAELSRAATLIAVRGNHDRLFARDFNHLSINQYDHWSDDYITAIHGDRLHVAPSLDGRTLVLGHWHPCLGIRDAAGAEHKLPVFLASSTCITLPAFSPFARGYDIGCGLPEDLLACFAAAPVEVYASSATRVMRLGPLHEALEKMRQKEVNAPAKFRRRSAAG